MVVMTGAEANVCYTPGAVCTFGKGFNDAGDAITLPNPLPKALSLVPKQRLNVCFLVFNPLAESLDFSFQCSELPDFVLKDRLSWSMNLLVVLGLDEG